MNARTEDGSPSSATKSLVLIERLQQKAFRTGRVYPRNRTIQELFEEQVQYSPDAIAVVFEGQQLTYDELNRRANQLAHHLRTRGVGPERVVAIAVERSIEMIVALLATLKAGGAYLPLDPKYPRERLALMMADARCS